MPWHRELDVPGAPQVYCVNSSGQSGHGWALAAFSGPSSAHVCVVELFPAYPRFLYKYLPEMDPGSNSMLITRLGSTKVQVQI